MGGSGSKKKRPQGSGAWATGLDTPQPAAPVPVRNSYEHTQPIDVSMIPDSQQFSVVDLDANKQGRFIIAFPELLHCDTRNVLILRWNIKDLRSYGQLGEEFSFATGRNNPTGVYVKKYRVEGGRDIYVELNRVVGEHNHGVGGDRYDHTPFQRQQSQAEGLYNQLDRDGPAVAQDTYDHPVRQGTGMPPPADTYDHPVRQGTGIPPPADTYDHPVRHGTDMPPPADTYDHPVRHSGRQGSATSLPPQSTYNQLKRPHPSALGGLQMGNPEAMYSAAVEPGTSAPAVDPGYAMIPNLGQTPYETPHIAQTPGSAYEVPGTQRAIAHPPGSSRYEFN